MTWFLRNRQPDPEAPPLPRPLPNWAAQVSSAAALQGIEDDSWGRARGVSRDVMREIALRLGDAAPRYFEPPPEDEDPAQDLQDPDQRFLRRVLDRASEAAAADPGAWAGVPVTIEDFEAEVLRRRQAEYDEAQGVLDVGGSGSAEFLGRAAAAMTDEVSLLTLPLGFGSLARGQVLRFIASEAAIGAASEAAILPRAQRVASELDVPEVDPFQRIAFGAIAAGSLAGGLAGLARGLEYARGRTLASQGATSADTDPLTFSAQVQAAETDLRTGVSQSDRQPAADPAQPVIDERPGSPASRFVFTPGGNAAPQENPVGYVYGRLLELGYPPHIASGLTGNLMQESGPALNTRAVGDGGNAYGMGQWNGPRRRALYTWAEARGLDVNDIETQVQFLHHELQGPESAALRAILEAPDAETAARVASERFWRPGEPHLANRIGYAAAIQRQYTMGEVPRGGRPDPVRPQQAAAPGFFDAAAGGRRSTAPDEVSGPQGTRTGVRWEVVEASSLRAASGDLQPRDRSRAASDEQIARIAADLDPARLMPGPEADRGAPIVGGDDVVESGNGRVAAIVRAAEQHPDRYQAYVAAIEDAGHDISGLRRPVLIGRRTGDMTPEARIAWVRENNTSAIARMGAAEQARVDAAALTQPVMDALRPGADLAAPENGDFLRRMMAALPATERSALIDAEGRVTMDGLRRIRSALFIRAWDAPDLARLLTEKPSAELRALVDMLHDLAPEWAHFRAMVEAGYIRPDYDITRPVTDMVRLIGTLRAADRDGQSVIAALRDHLATPDLLAPRDDALNAVLPEVFYRGETARRPAAAADILRRHAADAAIAGRADLDDLFQAPPPPDAVLRRAIEAQNKGEAMPPPPAAPARVAPPEIDPAPEAARDALPEAPDGAASADLAARAAATEAEARAAVTPAETPTETPASPRPDASRQTAPDPDITTRPGTEARDAVAVDAADFLALRDATFRLTDDGPELSLREVLDALDGEAALEDAIRFCTLGGRP